LKRSYRLYQDWHYKNIVLIIIIAIKIAPCFHNFAPGFVGTHNKVSCYLKSVNMKKGLIFFGAYFLLLNLQAQTAPPPAKDINKILSITNTDYDMGRIAAGKPLEYNLVIKNISNDTVVLQDVKAGCGCTTPKFKAGEKLVPGKSTFITLGFNGGASGEFSKFADIYFSDGLSKQVKFHGFAVVDSTNQPKPPIANNK